MKQFILTSVLAVFASQASAMFIQPDWLDPTNPCVGTNRYSYSFNDPMNRVDPNGNESMVIGDKVFINPEDPTVPRVVLPNNNTNAEGLTVKHFGFHQYNYTRKAPEQFQGLEGGRILADALANNPTPGNDMTATADGIPNHVGNLPGPDGGDNYVLTCRVESPNPEFWTNITVNYTVQGAHMIDEGFVMRYGEIQRDGSIVLRSYGEGNPFEQSGLVQHLTFGFPNRQVEAVWQQNYDEIFESFE